MSLFIAVCAEKCQNGGLCIGVLPDKCEYKRGYMGAHCEECKWQLNIIMLNQSTFFSAFYDMLMQLSNKSVSNLWSNYIAMIVVKI